MQLHVIFLILLWPFVTPDLGVGFLRHFSSLLFHRWAPLNVFGVCLSFVDCGVFGKWLKNVLYCYRHDKSNKAIASCILATVAPISLSVCERFSWRADLLGRIVLLSNHLILVKPLLPVILIFYEPHLNKKHFAIAVTVLRSLSLSYSTVTHHLPPSICVLIAK